MLTEEFDGQVRHISPDGQSKMWVDQWWGPGGHLVVRRVDLAAPVRWLDDEKRNVVDHIETLTRPNNTVVQCPGTQGADYELLPELFGPELWEKRHAA